MVTRIKRIFPKVYVPRSKKSKVPVSLRSFRDEVYYGIRKQVSKPKSFLEETPIREWKYWALIENAFPYNIAFSANHMLIPKREVPVEELNKKEKSELDKILNELSSAYDCHMTNFPSKQSRKNHYHIHMLIFKNHRREMRI